MYRFLSLFLRLFLLLRIRRFRCWLGCTLLDDFSDPQTIPVGERNRVTDLILPRTEIKMVTNIGSLAPSSSSMLNVPMSDEDGFFLNLYLFHLQRLKERLQLILRAEHELVGALANQERTTFPRSGNDEVPRGYTIIHGKVVVTRLSRTGVLRDQVTTSTAGQHVAQGAVVNVQERTYDTGPQVLQCSAPRRPHTLLVGLQERHLQLPRRLNPANAPPEVPLILLWNSSACYKVPEVSLGLVYYPHSTRKCGEDEVE